MLRKPDNQVHQERQQHQQQQRRQHQRGAGRSLLQQWIRDNVSKKECLMFQSDGGGDRGLFCKCGYLKSQHADEAVKPDGCADETWSRDGHVREVPTDAFGKVSFDGQRSAKYARVSSDSSPDMLYQLLTEQWKLSPPNLLISVTGGAKNFYLKSRLKDMFRRGLVKVAQTTGAWIITGGTHAGVMKHVGQAVRDHALSSSLSGRIVAIGVATWGIIHNREALVHAEGCFPAHYTMDIKGQGHLSCLDSNHTHFLLVDDGTQGQYGVEIQLRTRLEKCISGKSLGHKGSSVTIPAVCVVLDGGPGTLNTIYNAMLNGTPCVILEGSGRIADVIAQVAALPVREVTISLIQRLMKKFFGQEYESFTSGKIIEWTKKIQDIIRISQLLTVFRVCEDSQGDVDVAILQALLKASKTSESQGSESWKRQLELAIAWNRVDIAKTEIFTEESQWKSSDLHQAMLSALLGHKPQFVRLLLETGVKLWDFLQDDDTLCELYQQMPSCFFLRRVAKRVHGSWRRRRRHRGGPRPRHTSENTISLCDVSDEVRHLLGSFTQHLYPPSTTLSSFSMSLEDSSTDSLAKSQADSQAALAREEPAEAPRDPGRDLFLWAVVQNNKELAEIAWEQCQDCTSAALAATKILKKLAQQESDADQAASTAELAAHYERHAIGVFTECHNSNPEQAQKLLVRVSPYWGRTTCLRLALEADDKNFVAQSGVQALLTQIWCGELSVDNSLWRLLLCMLFFPLIYTGFLSFRRDEVIQREAAKHEEIRTMEEMTGSISTVAKVTFHSRLKRTKPLDRCAKLLCLYSSPQVKFYWNIVSYFAFLLLFAWVLMVDFQAWPAPLEILLYVWLATLVCEEIRQLFQESDGFAFQKKARRYIDDIWNILDLLSIVLFVIGLGLRLTERLFYAGKVILCIDFVVFCLRLMSIFTISRTLGPKIIIVRRMMTDLFFFMFLLSIWVVAYGVAKQGILIHNDVRLDWILRGAVYEPYRIIFGDFPTNIDYAAFEIESCTLDGSDRTKPKCPVLSENSDGSLAPAFPEWLTITLLCVYLLFANILLLNLLIAIFNFTFEEVQENTDRIWKFQRYELIKEYTSRPAAPPPFIIFSHVYILVRYLVLCRPQNLHKQFRTVLPQNEEDKLLSWEALMKDRYLLKTQEEYHQSTERRVLDTSQKVGAMSERLEREEGVARRLARLEEQVGQSAKALQWIVDSLRSRGFAAPGTPPSLSAATDEPGYSRASEKEDHYHVNARQLYYPGGKVTRYPVPEEKVPWQVSFVAYAPTRHGCEDAVDSGDSYRSGSKASDEYRNPGGRTGVYGRGALGRLGPNRSLDLVLTRWQDKRLSVLEYLAVCDDSRGTLSLPGGPVDSDEHLPLGLRTTLGNTLYKALNEKMADGTKVFEGYVDDCRNTDNAWVENTVLNIHLGRKNPLLTTVKNAVAGGHEALQWRELSGKGRLTAEHRDSLRRVAEHHNSKF